MRGTTGWIMGLLAVVMLTFQPPVIAGEFEMRWEGTRPWAGPQAWASPLYDWRVEDNLLVVTPGPDRMLQNTVWRIEDGDAELVLATRLVFRGHGLVQNRSGIWAGFSMGIKGLMDDPRHVLVGPMQRLNMGIRADGRLFIGDQVSTDSVELDRTVVLLAFRDEVGLRIEAFNVGETRPDKMIEVALRVQPEQLVGNVALAVGGPRNGVPEHVKILFEMWSGEGDALVANQANAFGPILWSQYTRQGNDVKLLAMLAPLGDDDPRAVDLQIKQADTWQTLDKQDYDPLTRSALLAGTVPDGGVEYRVRYRFQGEDHFWQGTFIPDPATTGEPLKIGVFSCDHGYAFPLPTLVQNVAEHDPNLLFFAGDQIYEVYGGFGVTRTPPESVDKAMLDYLRRYYQFGWTWRELLKDRPSIIIPDDHDVFQGNIWGAGGRATRNIDDGGYRMHPDWVNGVQRTQTAHLPDPHDPTPVQQGIGVYYTDLSWGGVPIAVIEDRKWKTGPNGVLPRGREARNNLTPEQADIPGAQLLGERQEAFLRAWSNDTADQPLRMVFSQTIFSKGHTHTGPELNQNHYDWDSNGWPRSGRDRALRPFRDGKTVMLHGDQHLGLLVRQGIDEHNDGPYAFMVPGTSNGWPRAWWPNGPDGEVTGHFTDPFGNRFTVLAAANPEPGTNKLPTRRQGDPERSAHAKGSGYGVVTVDPQTHAVTFNLYRYLIDAADPQPGDQFPGFPVTIQPR